VHIPCFAINSTCHYCAVKMLIFLLGFFCVQPQLFATVALFESNCKLRHKEWK
jgi:hypothetical protein